MVNSGSYKDRNEKAAITQPPTNNGIRDDPASSVATALVLCKPDFATADAAAIEPPTTKMSDDDAEVSALTLLEDNSFCNNSIDNTKVKTTSRKLLCLYCDRTFVSANLRQKHVERSHSAKQTRRVSPRQILTATPCTHCDKLNNTEHTLKDLFLHLSTEHSNKYYACSPCEERFLSPSQLTEHNASNHPLKTETPVNTNTETVEETPQKVTRSRLKLSESTVEVKKPPNGSKKKKVSIKASKIGIKRSKRLQAKDPIDSSKVRRSQKPSNNNKNLDPSSSSTNSKPSTSCVNPYPEFDANYRVKKITDHSIDNLKISSLTFDDVFDKAFFNRIKCNIQENLLHHLDGKLFKNEESESRISNFEKTPNVQTEVQSSTETYGCELSINAITPVAALSLNSQYGEDFESQIEYGSKPSKKKNQTKSKDEVHYKYFTRRKYQASILEHKENRDLSKLDMWTQLVIKNRQQRIVDDTKSAKEILEYTTGDEYKNKTRKEELNRILDRRGPFEDLREEATKQAALDKLNSNSTQKISQETFSEVREVLNEILKRVHDLCELEDRAPKLEPDLIQQPEERELPSYLNLRKTCTLPIEGDIDKSDKIALICSSQETENFELPTNTIRSQNEQVELTGEWARTRMFICAACGKKIPNIKQLLEHKSIFHQNVWVQHYEFVGNQNELYRHLSIPGLGKVGVVEDSVPCRQWRRSDARLCTKCGKQCNALGELHRHVLECGGDWTWMLARKKCKYRPFGARTRRKRRGLLKRSHRPTNKTDIPAEKKPYKKPIDGPRQRPSDADTIQRMLANLPAKRSTRKIMSMQDGSRRKTKKAEKAAQSSKVKCGKVIYKNVKGVDKMSSPKTVKNVKRNFNTVLSSRLLDSNSTLRTKRILKNLVNKRVTRQNKEQQDEEVVEEEEKPLDTVVEEEEQSPKRKKSNKNKENQDENNETVEPIKRVSPRKEKTVSPQQSKKKITVKKILTGKINIKSFFPVKKKKKVNSTETETSEITTRTKRRSKENTEETDTKNNKKGIVNTLVRTLSMKKKKKPETTTTQSENLETTSSTEPIKTDAQKKRKLGKSFRKVIKKVKKQKVQETTDPIVSEKEEKQTVVEEVTQVPFLEKPFTAEMEKIVSPSILEKNIENIVDNTTSVPTAISCLENTIVPETIFNLETSNEKSLQAKGELNFDTKETHEITTEIPLMDKQTIVDDTQTKTVPIITITEVANENKKPDITEDKTGPITIETSSKCSNSPLSSPLSSLISPLSTSMISPSCKKVRKPARGLNDCIAMLTNKLHQKNDDTKTKSDETLPTTTTERKTDDLKIAEKPIVPKLIEKPAVQKPECILKIPTFIKSTISEPVMDQALDLTKKSTESLDLSTRKSTECLLSPKLAKSSENISKDILPPIHFEPLMTRPAFSFPSLLGLHTAFLFPPDPLAMQRFASLSNLDRVIESVVENKQPIRVSSSIDNIIQQVVENSYNSKNMKIPSPTKDKNSVDNVIDFVIKQYAHKEETELKIPEMKPKERKIGSIRKPQPKAQEEPTQPTEESLNTAFTEEKPEPEQPITSEPEKRKIGEPRKRSKKKSKPKPKPTPTEPKPEQPVLETNLDDLLNTNEIASKTEISSSSTIVKNAIIQSTEEKDINELVNEDEPHLLESKLVPKSIPKSEEAQSSDSEDDVPLAVLAKPDNKVQKDDNTNIQPEQPKEASENVVKTPEPTKVVKVVKKTPNKRGRKPKPKVKPVEVIEKPVKNIEKPEEVTEKPKEVTEKLEEVIPEAAEKVVPTEVVEKVVEEVVEPSKEAIIEKPLEIVEKIVDNEPQTLPVVKESIPELQPEVTPDQEIEKVKESIPEKPKDIAEDIIVETNKEPDILIKEIQELTEDKTATDIKPNTPETIEVIPEKPTAKVIQSPKKRGRRGKKGKRGAKKVKQQIIKEIAAETQPATIEKPKDTPEESDLSQSIIETEQSLIQDTINTTEAETKTTELLPVDATTEVLLEEKQPEEVPEPQPKPVEVSEPQPKPLEVPEPQPKPLGVPEPQAKPLEVPEPQAKPVEVTPPVVESIPAKKTEGHIKMQIKRQGKSKTRLSSIILSDDNVSTEESSLGIPKPEEVKESVVSTPEIKEKPETPKPKKKGRKSKIAPEIPAEQIETDSSTIDSTGEVSKRSTKTLKKLSRTTSETKIVENATATPKEDEVKKVTSTPKLITKITRKKSSGNMEEYFADSSVQEIPTNISEEPEPEQKIQSTFEIEVEQPKLDIPEEKITSKNDEIKSTESTVEQESVEEILVTPTEVKRRGRPKAKSLPIEANSQPEKPSESETDTSEIKLDTPKEKIVKKPGRKKRSIKGKSPAKAVDNKQPIIQEKPVENIETAVVEEKPEEIIEEIPIELPLIKEPEKIELPKETSTPKTGKKRRGQKAKPSNTIVENIETINTETITEQPLEIITPTEKIEKSKIEEPSNEIVEKTPAILNNSLDVFDFQSELDEETPISKPKNNKRGRKPKSTIKPTLEEPKNDEKPNLQRRGSKRLEKSSIITPEEPTENTNIDTTESKKPVKKQAVRKSKKSIENAPEIEKSDTSILTDEPKVDLQEVVPKIVVKKRKSSKESSPSKSLVTTENEDVNYFVGSSQKEDLTTVETKPNEIEEDDKTDDIFTETVEEEPVVEEPVVEPEVTLPVVESKYNNIIKPSQFKDTFRTLKSPVLPLETPEIISKKGRGRKSTKTKTTELPTANEESTLNTKQVENESITEDLQPTIESIDSTKKKIRKKKSELDKLTAAAAILPDLNFIASDMDITRKSRASKTKAAEKISKVTVAENVKYTEDVDLEKNLEKILVEIDNAKDDDDSFDTLDDTIVFEDKKPKGKKRVKQNVIEETSSKEDLTLKKFKPESEILEDLANIILPNEEEIKKKPKRKSKTSKKLDNKNMENNLFQDFTLVINSKSRSDFIFNGFDDDVVEENTDVKKPEMDKPKPETPKPSLLDDDDDSLGNDNDAFDESFDMVDMELEDIPTNNPIIEREIPLNPVVKASTDELFDKLLNDNKPTNVPTEKHIEKTTFESKEPEIKPVEEPKIDTISTEKPKFDFNKYYLEKISKENPTIETSDLESVASPKILSSEDSFDKIIKETKSKVIPEIKSTKADIYDFDDDDFDDLLINPIKKSTELFTTTKPSNEESIFSNKNGINKSLNDSEVSIDETDGLINKKSTKKKAKTPATKRKPKQKPTSNIDLLDEQLLFDKSTEENLEIRRSRRSKKVTSYNESELEETLMGIDEKIKSRKKDKSPDNGLIDITENITLQTPLPKSSPITPDKKINTDELFDMLKGDAITAEVNSKVDSPFMENLDDTSEDFNDDKFDNAFENILEKSMAVIQNQEDHKKSDIYEFTESPPNEEIIEKKLTKIDDTASDILENDSVSDKSSFKASKTTKTDKAKDNKNKPNYCEICKKSFIRLENLVKHKRTLTHISKLSEIEAKEAEEKAKQQTETFKLSELILDDYESKNDASISSISSENQPTTLELADLINDVINEPEQQSVDVVQPEIRRYKSLGERKSFESESSLLNNDTRSIKSPFYEPALSKTTILEKQISLLQNIIENQSGMSYIDDISMSSNNSVTSKNSSSEMLKDSSYTKAASLSSKSKSKTNEESFIKPATQYEEISEDSTNIRNYEEQKLRKTLNRDEELFLECCSLLKSGSEVSNYSNSKSNNKPPNIPNKIDLQSADEPNWLENKSLSNQNQSYNVEYSDNSRIPTPLGDNFADDASNSNTINSNWGDKDMFEDIDKDNNSFTFEEVLNNTDKEEKAKSGLSRFGGMLSKTIKNQISSITNRINRFEDRRGSSSERKIDELSDCSTSDSKKVMTKGAMKVFEGLKVSIPTEELNLEEVLNCSPRIKKTIEMLNKDKESPKSEELLLSPSKRNARKSKPVKNKSQFGSKLLFKMNKKKHKNDVYDFEDTQDQQQDKKTKNDTEETKKPKSQQNLTKKKCMIMGRIFKNAVKSKVEEEIRDIPIIENTELVENFVKDVTKSTENNISDNEDQDNINKSKYIEGRRKSKQKNSRKRQRANSESTDDEEFSINKTTKKRNYKKNPKPEDNCINLEQELKECIGVASRKSQRKCTSGKQNVLVEYWSSDDSAFEALLESQIIETKDIVKIKKPEKIVETKTKPKSPVEEIVQDIIEQMPAPKIMEKKTNQKPKKPKTKTHKSDTTAATSNRRKRAAVNPLYHWSSSSEDESSDLITVKPIRDEADDDDERPIQHGWIVGDSPKKLVTLLAHAKGKKTDIDSVKEQKKRTNSIS